MRPVEGGLRAVVVTADGRVYRATGQVGPPVSEAHAAFDPAPDVRPATTSVAATSRHCASGPRSTAGVAKSAAGSR